MSAQELASIIELVDETNGWDPDPGVYEKYGAAILAAGYRKPRTINTAKELDALPDDSVVLDDMDGPLIKVGNWWHSPTDEMSSNSVIFPTTVLYEPAA